MFLLSFFSSFFLSLFTFIKGNSKSCIVVLLIITLFLFAGTRNEGIDPDYEVYVQNFSYCMSPLFEANDFILFEPSTFIIPFIGKLLFGNLLFIKFSIFIFAMLGVSTKIMAIRDTNFFFWSVLLYCCYSFFYQEMITIRAGVASGIFLLAVKDLETKNDKRYFFKIVIALFFHYSSVIFLLVWAFVRLKFSIKVFYGILLASFFIAILQINLLMLLRIDLLIPKVKIYFDLMELEGNAKINLFNYRILISLFIFFLFVYAFKLLEKEPYFLTLFKIHIVSLILFFIFSTSAIVFSDRTYDLLAIAQVLLYPFVILVFKERIVGYTILGTICAINLFFIIHVSQLFTNYSSWLF